ncbi:PepSY domain-containing protein [Pseudomonas syringae]|uniref:Peptidase n=1 Tax=Pseudomonas syringae TaxID=317 RepID=A0A085VLE6_PSESX|nr:PepSY domain-containing protein [Pseudomonas syringae]KFE56259.1 peptidase [Pseudomonas syringae]
MNVDKRRGTLLLIVLLTASVQARDLDQDEALRLRQQGTILALEQLVDKALGRHPGAKLLEAELEEKHGVFVYEFELLTTEGSVRELKFDARDGRLLKDEED